MFAGSWSKLDFTQLGLTISLDRDVPITSRNGNTGSFLCRVMVLWLLFLKTKQIEAGVEVIACDCRYFMNFAGSKIIQRNLFCSVFIIKLEN